MFRLSSQVTIEGEAAKYTLADSGTIQSTPANLAPTKYGFAEEVGFKQDFGIFTEKGCENVNEMPETSAQSQICIMGGSKAKKGRSKANMAVSKANDYTTLEIPLEKPLESPLEETDPLLRRGSVLDLHIFPTPKLNLSSEQVRSVNESRGVIDDLPGNPIQINRCRASGGPVKASSVPVPHSLGPASSN